MSKPRPKFRIGDIVKVIVRNCPEYGMKYKVLEMEYYAYGGWMYMGLYGKSDNGFSENGLKKVK